ncbi:hypothetical protein [Nostoc sphaeroides]|uniref:hypothetical protein n=1 Tax=Nostoc sphaeroides TaxID=446679 RepID=UPI000E4EC33B|nr:hypothetical protein [Nostoc sphaeroides]
MQKVFLYLNLALMFFPAFSLSYIFIGIYFQSRILGLPLLAFYIINKDIEIRKSLIFLIFPFLISIIVPILGLVSDRNFSLIDIGYILSFLYLILFAQSMYKNIKLFINFIKIFTVANLVYGIIQTFLANIGLNRLTMIHSNLPSQSISEYSIPPSILPYTYRFSGLFNESSPLIFYLCSSYVFLSQINSNKKSIFINVIQIITIIAIAISGSKFSYAFFIVVAVNKLISLLKLSQNINNAIKIFLVALTAYFL